VSDMVEKVARAILYDFMPHVDAWEIVDEANRNRCRSYARAALEATAPLVERAFKDGLAYAGNVHNPDPELAWQQSRVRASLQEMKR